MGSNHIQKRCHSTWDINFTAVTTVNTGMNIQLAP
jgi:hypothetical protein